MIPTDTPEKQQLEAQKAAAAARKKPAAKDKTKKRPTKRSCIPAKRRRTDPSTTTSDEDDPGAVPLADSDASEEWVEEEDENGPLVVDPEALDKLERDPIEEEYVLIRIKTPTVNKKGQKVTLNWKSAFERRWACDCEHAQTECQRKR